MEELVNLITKTYGIAGLILISPFVAAAYLWKSNVKLNEDRLADIKKHQADTTALNEAHNARLEAAYNASLARTTEASDKVIAAQVQRVHDAQAIGGKLMEIVSEQSSLNRETNFALERLHDRVGGGKG